ncbi:MAG: Sporulation transcriptional regulator SpoIIID [Clostridia bacterium 41_269]|nr:MAG: Sporulation transcriptional regulator SpoIIID [Clostridia bacterium 41_269]
MQEHIRKRVILIGCYIVEHSATVRQAAKVFQVSKSTVHKDVTERLPQIDRDLASQVRKVLDVNKAERHIRGGEATRRRYKEAKMGKVSQKKQEKLSP